MRVLHVNHAWGTAGGTESYLARLVPAQLAMGLECAVAVERLPSMPVDVPLLEVQGLRDAASSEAGVALGEAFRRFRPDVIHVHQVANPGVLELAPTLAPTVSFIHDHTAFCPGLNKEYADGGLCDHALGKYCLERYRGEGCLCLRPARAYVAARQLLATRRVLRAQRRLARIVVASDYMRRELECAGVEPERLSVVPLFAGPVEAPAPSACGSRLLMLGRLAHPDKGVEPLLEALAALRVPFEARIVGEGPDRARFESRRSDLGLEDRVEFAGAVSHDQVPEALSRARVVAVPSMWNEPFGIVGLEAMACGRPVVAFDVGAVGEWLIPGETGLLVDRGDVNGLSLALQRLLEDDALADRLGAAGRRRAITAFGQAAHLESLQQIYEHAVAGSASSPDSQVPDRVWLAESLTQMIEEQRWVEELLAAPDGDEDREKQELRSMYERASSAHDRLREHHRDVVESMSRELRAAAAALPPWKGGLRRRLLELAASLDRERGSRGPE